MVTKEKIMIITTNSVPGKEIIKTFGMIEARCGRSVLSEEKSAREKLFKKAIEVGANAIVGYSCMARGTAVLVE